MGHRIDEMLKITGNDTIMEFKLRDKDINNKNIELLFNYSGIKWDDLTFSHNMFIHKDVQCLSTKDINDYVDIFSDTVMESSFPIEMIGYKIEGCEPTVTFKKATESDCTEIKSKLCANEKKTLVTIHDITFRCLVFNKGVTGVSKPVTVKLVINGNESPRDCVERLLLQRYTSLLTFNRNWEIIEVNCESKDYRWEALPNVIGVLPLLRRGTIYKDTINKHHEQVEKNSVSEELYQLTNLKDLFSGCNYNRCSPDKLQLAKKDNIEFRKLTLCRDELNRSIPLRMYKLKTNNNKPFLNINEEVSSDGVNIKNLNIINWKDDEMNVTDGCSAVSHNSITGTYTLKCIPDCSNDDEVYSLLFILDSEKNNFYFSYSKSEPNMEDISSITFALPVKNK